MRTIVSKHKAKLLRISYCSKLLRNKPRPMLPSPLKSNPNKAGVAATVATAELLAAVVLVLVAVVEMVVQVTEAALTAVVATEAPVEAALTAAEAVETSRCSMTTHCSSHSKLE